MNEELVLTALLCSPRLCFLFTLPIFLFRSSGPARYRLPPVVASHVTQTPSAFCDVDSGCARVWIPADAVDQTFVFYLS